MDRRDFAAMIPAILTWVSLEAAAQTSAPKALAPRTLKELTSGVFTPSAEKNGSQPGHRSRAFTSGLLKAGNIRLEIHESMQDSGAEHEPVGTHLHNEIWFIQKGIASLFINGTEHRLEAGDVGLVCAGDKHWIKNAGEGELAYLVLAVGPPE